MVIFIYVYLYMYQIFDAWDNKACVQYIYIYVYLFDKRKILQCWPLQNLQELIQELIDDDNKNYSMHSIIQLTNALKKPF